MSSGGTSGMSNEASATPLPPPPAAPTGLAATPGNTQVSLTWNASAGAASYNVYRGTTAGGQSATPVATNITTTSYTNTGLTNGTTYYYKVAALNLGGISAMSNEASAQPRPPAPAAPTGLAATAGNAQVALTWNASTGATGYRVYRSTTSGGQGTTPLADIPGTSYTNVNLTNGTTYYYKVSAYNSTGESAKSTEVSARPVSPLDAQRLSRTNSGFRYWATGFSNVENVNEYNALNTKMNDRLVGRTYAPDIMTVFGSHGDSGGWSGWAAYPLQNPRIPATRAYLAPGGYVVLSQTMVPETAGISNAGNANPAVFDEIANGTHDARFRTLATNLKTLLQGTGYAGAAIPNNRVIIRLAWEFNHSSYSHFAGSNLVGFKAAWRRAVNVLRGEMPGVRFDFFATPDKTRIPQKPGGGYYSYADYNPGKDYVDFYSLSVHDGYPVVSTATLWTQRETGTSSRHGLNDVLAVAQANDRLIGCAEWGASISRDGGTTNPALIIGNTNFQDSNASGFMSWLWQNREYIGFETYFNTSDSNLLADANGFGAVYFPTWTHTALYQ